MAFALTFGGYDRWGSIECTETANRWVTTYAERQALPDSLTELRTCLFFEQRRWHHVDSEPGERAAGYIRAMVEAIRGRVEAGQVG